VRTVPIPICVKSKVDAWLIAAAITRGPAFRAINKAGRVWGDGMSPKVLWDVVRPAAARRDRQAGPARPAAHLRPSLPSGGAANLIRSSSYSATSPSRQPNATLDASRSSGSR
jgi:hypothetical protein